MGELDKELQVYAVQLVLDEIEMYERTLDSVDASWWETYLNCTLPQEFFDNPEGVNEKLDSEATKIDKATYTTESCGIPLKRIVLGGEYVCDIGTIKWNNIRSKKAERRVVFSNDGTISFAKMALCYSNKIRGDYDGSYNVLSDNFKITFTEYERLQRGDKVIFEPKCTKMELHNATLVVSRGDFNLVHNLETGLYAVRIIKKHKMYKSPDLVFEAKMDENGQLIKSSLEMKTFKGNGKENGTYRIDGSRDTGIKANFYSRKGVKVNLAQSPVLLERAYVLMLNPSTEERTSKEGISVLNSFTRSTKRAIDVAKGLSERTINFDASDFNMESALGLEIHAVEMLRNIKGEVLVEGFVQRIDEFLEQFDMSKRASYQMKPMIGAGK